jgi:hypothetical protein
MSNITGNNFLEQVAGSFIGALIQREHIKNKRLDDLVTTTGNYQQQNLQTALERVNQKMGAAMKAQGLEISPTVEYGAFPRQLGVTPYPPPPPTINMNDQQHSYNEESKSSQVPQPVQSAPIKKDSSPQESVKTETKSKIPWANIALGTALTAALGSNAFLAYKMLNPSSSQQAEQPSQSVIIPPSSELLIDGQSGSVTVDVE